MDWYFEPDCEKINDFIDELRKDCDWIDDLADEMCWEKELHNYECKVYNELDRRIV